VILGLALVAQLMQRHEILVRDVGHAAKLPLEAVAPRSRALCATESHCHRTVGPCRLTRRPLLYWSACSRPTMGSQRRGPMGPCFGCDFAVDPNYWARGRFLARARGFGSDAEGVERHDLRRLDDPDQRLRAQVLLFPG
jgi:hypothetical protein